MQTPVLSFIWTAFTYKCPPTGGPEKRGCFTSKERHCRKGQAFKYFQGPLWLALSRCPGMQDELPRTRRKKWIMGRWERFLRKWSGTKQESSKVVVWASLLLALDATVEKGRTMNSYIVYLLGARKLAQVYNKIPIMTLRRKISLSLVYAWESRG